MYRIRVVATGVAGAPYYLNHYFDGINAEDQAANLAALYEDMAPNISNRLAFRGEGTAVTLDETTGAIVAETSVAGFDIPGGTLFEMCPGQIQYLIRLNTQTVAGGRRIQGRMNIPGVVENAVNPDGVVLDANRTSLTSAWTTFITAVQAAEGDVVVWSRKNGLAAPVFTAPCQTLVATLRSRSARG